MLPTRSRPPRTSRAQASSTPGAPKQTTLAPLILDSLREQPRALGELYELVLYLRPGTAKETVRARVYEHLAKGRLLRIARGVFVAIDGPAQLVLVTGDAWTIMPQLPSESIDLILSDIPADLGTKQNAQRHGTSRGPRGKGRTYEQRDPDREWFRQAHRLLVKRRPYPALRGGPPKQAGGFCVIWSPPRNRDTRKHIDALIALAESCGFEYVFEQVVDYEHRIGGYWPAQRHWLWHYFCATPRAGIPRDARHNQSVLRVRRVHRACDPTAREHEAEKPIEAFLAPIRMLTSPGDVVLDPFCGRARWARRVQALGRRVILVDKDPKWIERILQEDILGPSEATACPA